MQSMTSIATITNGLNGEPVIIKITGIKGGSVNSKTGEMIQSTLMPVAWYEAAKEGKDALKDAMKHDEAVCSGCIHSQGKDGTCYVRKGQSLWGLLSSLRANVKADQLVPFGHLPKFAHLFKDKAFRFGTYGDPVLLGEANVKAITQASVNWTGYTHQWREPQYQWAKEYFMASVETNEQAQLAHSMGWRTFRVRKATDPVAKSEVTCPASKEAGYKTTCIKCGLCKGASRKAKSVVTIEH
jgi:hypothetical protein